MKVLITADIHINDYASYNYEYHSRLNSFYKLADRFIELGEKYECEELWILGDLIDKPNSRPYILHVANKFMSKLCSHFKTVRYILGNHDLDTKSQGLTVEDSQVTIFDYPNLVYMDRKLVNWDGNKYAFMNWRPEQDLDWLGEEHVDVLFGHYTKSELFGQDIDESKFDLMIHGDIHNSQVIGKFVSVCNPIQKDMSSEAEGKVILFDTLTKRWDRLAVDKDHTRFLQIHYTNDINEEGFRGPLQYNIYKPDITTGEVVEQEKALNWNDIDDLINTTCQINGLEDIHAEISSKSEQFEEIDFNFQLLRLKIHGYRSVEDLDLDFNKGDRIALLGANGSGKSSIIRALQGAFLKNSDLKYEQSSFTDNVQITLTLMYQNKIYEINKGSSWGLVIDGQEQAYHGIRDFEGDLLVKLPFLNFLDLFFLNSNISNLSNQFSPTRRIELIGKFYRLDRINAYWSTAMELWRNTNAKLTEVINTRNVKIGTQDYIRSRISELAEYETFTIEQFQEELDNYRTLRERYNERKTWVSKLQDLGSQRVDLENAITGLQSRLTFDYDQGLRDLAEMKEKADKANDIYEDLYQKSIEFESMLKSIREIEEEGGKVASKLQSLNSGICPECGGSLSKTKNADLVRQYSEERERLGKQWDELDAKIATHKYGRDSLDYYKTSLQNLKSSYAELKGNIEVLDNKIKNHSTYLAQLEVKQADLIRINELISAHKELEPKEVLLPLDINQREFTANSNISKIEELKRNKNDLDSINAEIEELDKEINEFNVKLDKYNRYIELTSISGVIYEQILTQLAVKFSTTEIKYEVESGMYRGSRYINFNSYYLSRGTYRIYESCSDGQKTVCDLDFLEKLFSVNIGMLTLDEYLKHLDDDNFSKVCDILTRMNVNTILLSTHDSNLTAYTRRILLSLDSIGRTVMSQV